MTVTETIDYLKKYVSKGGQVTVIAAETGISKHKIYKWLDEKTIASPKSQDLEVIQKWISKIELVPQSQPYHKRRLAQKLEEPKEEDSIPVYVGNTRLGTIQVYSDDPEMQQPIGHLPASIFPGCNHAEKVYGDSMYPIIINQAYVVGKVIDKRGIIWGEKYGIHTKYGQSMVKYLHPSEKGDSYLKIVSYNKTIPDQDIPFDDITFVFRILFIVNPS